MSNTIKIGTNNINAIKLGSVDVDAVYLGTNLVYTSTPPTPSSKKLQLTYSDSSTYDIDCDTATTLAQSDVRGGSGSSTAITRAVVGDCVTSIGQKAFSGCTNMTVCNIPNSVTSIGDYAFSNCSGLTSITIPNSITSFGLSVFNGCSSLTSITIPDSVTSIGNGVFSGCTSLTSINLPNSLTSIGQYDFRDCTSLTSINIPSGVTSIGANAFNGCSGLTSINIPNGVTSIDVAAFRGCSSLTSIDIPNGVTSIHNYTFQGCRSITSIDIPSGVTSIGQQAFSSCSGLTSINIPSGVTSIGAYAFGYCSSLTSIDIPSGVTIIDTQTFQGCRGLTSIDIPSGVTSIGAYAFQYCTSLTSIDIPNGVTSIGQQAFSGCTSLTSIVFESATPPTLGTEAFRDTNNCPIYVPCESVGAYVAANGWSEYASRVMAESPLFNYRWVETQDTVCENGNLCAVEQYQWTCDGENYSASTLTRVGRVIESGSEQCAPKAAIFDAYELVGLSGNGTTSKEFTDGGVDFSSTQKWKLTGTTQGGSTASRISGKTDCTIALSSGGDINNVVFICHNTSTKDRLVQGLRDGTVTNGATTLDGTARYYVRIEFDTPQSSVVWQNGSQALNINMIGVNVPQGWETSLDDNS